jgi:APA family basic amino acid/polyamine antiporter
MATIAPRAGGRGRVKPLDEILATAEKKSLKRSLGAFQLTLLGIGAVIGTGIFVLTATAAQKAGPGMMVSFIVAGIVCALAALCYSELASMVPVAGSAYTYSYAVMGEIVAWLVGWALSRSAGRVSLRASSIPSGFTCRTHWPSGRPSSGASCKAAKLAECSTFRQSSSSLS